MSGYRTDDISGAFRSERTFNRRDRKRSRGELASANRGEGPKNTAIDRTTTTPFLIRVFPYVVALEDLEGAANGSEEASDAKKKPVGAAGLTKAYRPPDAYSFVYNPDEPSPADIEEIRIYTYADDTLRSVIDRVKEEMNARGLLRAQGSLGISIAAAWEEWHRNEKRFFMRCRSVGKVGMDDSWAKAAEGMGIDPRGFPDKSDETLERLKWKIGDAMDVCFLYA